MKWFIWFFSVALFTMPVLAADNLRTLSFADNEQFYKQFEEEAVSKNGSFRVLTNFTSPEQMPARFRKMINLEAYEEKLVTEDGKFVEGAKTTAVLTLVGASLASAISTGAVVGSAFLVRGVATGAAIGVAGGPIAPVTIAIAAGVGAVVGFTIGVTVVVMSGNEHEMMFEIDPTGKFRFQVKPI
jgi:hypothetical protein